MLKKVIALYIALAVALSGGVVVGTIVLKDIIKNNNIQKAMKAENETAVISEFFHDQGDIYVTPNEPTVEDEITFRLRTRRYNVTRAQIQYTADGDTWYTQDMKFEKHDDSGYYDYWKVTIPPQSEFIYYRFQVGNLNETTTIFYTYKSPNGEYSEPVSHTDGWLLMVGNDTPEWSKGTLWYSIIPDRFFNGDTISDDISCDNILNQWNNKAYINHSLNSKAGGDIVGIEQKIAYLRSLGVNSVFMNPVSRSTQNHGYGKIIHKEIENGFGTMATYISFINELHENDMYFMQDVDLAYVAASSLWNGSNYFAVDNSIYGDVFTNAGVTAWSGYALDLGAKLAQELIWTKEDSFLQYLVRESGVDAFRFDTGGWLWGTTATEDISADDIIVSMKYYLKKINPELMFLSESSGNTSMKYGGYDSQWNLSLMEKINEYAKGHASASNLYAVLKNTLNDLPRNVALNIYNDITSHDHTRAYGDEHTMKSAILLLMTYIGSPCIFYGEENNMFIESTGSDNDSKLMSFDWNPANWDYEYQNFYKAFGELRNEYSCVRTGVYKEIKVSDADKLISYARFDQNGKAIVIACQTKETKEIALNVRCAGIAEGAVLTDWLTGKKYTVLDGEVVVDVIPGGTVLVDGDKASSYRQEYELKSIGNGSKNATIYTLDDGNFSVKGSGKLAAKSDDILFGCVDTFDDFNVTARVDMIDGSAALMIRNGSASSAAYYSAVVNKNKLIIKTRVLNGAEAVELASCNITAGSYIRISRDVNNVFKAYVAVNNNGQLDDWAYINGTEKQVGMNNRVDVGLAAISGTVNFSELIREALDGVSGADTFDGSSTTSLLNGVNAANVSLGNGYLTIKPLSDSMGCVNTHPRDIDWTFKTKLNFTPAQQGNMAGVYCRGNEGEYVAVGRTIVDGKSVIYLGKATGNNFNILYTAEDTKPNEEVIVQLQKVGYIYNAIFSYDNKTWNSVGKGNILANFSENIIGLYVDGSQDASFNWASFGDCINDGKSVNTPHTPYELDTSFSSTATTLSGAFTAAQGNWELADEGVVQTDPTVLGKMSDTLRLYGAFRAQAVFKFDSGNGWAGMGFGKKSAVSDTDDGFLLKYSTDDVLTLYKGTTKISEVKLYNPDKADMKIVVEAYDDGKILVYAGEQSVIVMNCDDTGYVNGYFTYYTEGVVAHVNNYQINDYLGKWTELGGSAFGNGNTIRVIPNSITNPVGVGVTDFIVSVKIFTSYVSTATASASIIMGAPQGVTGVYGGVTLTVDQFGKIALTEGEKELAVAETGTALKNGQMSCHVMVIKQNGTYKVYINNQKTPIIQYTEDFNRGGVISLSSYASTAKFASFEVYNLSADEDYTTRKVYTDWIEGKTHGSTAMPTFTANMNSPTDISNFTILEGAWNTDNGALSCTSGTSWFDRVLVSNNIYDNFVMTFDVRADNSGGWFGVSLRSSDSNSLHAHQGGGFLVYFSPGGSTPKTVDSRDQSKGMPDYEAHVTSCPEYKKGSWYSVRIEAIGADVKVYHEDTLLASFTDDYYFDGYIRLTCGMSKASFDNIVIKPVVVD